MNTMHFPSSITIAVILFLSSITASLRAQSIDEIKTWSAGTFAQKMTEQMTPRVPLSEEQAGTVHKINLKFAEAVLPVLKTDEPVKSKIDAVKEFDQVRSEELAVFLNPEQMRQVRQIMMENRKKMKQRYVEKSL